MLAVNICSFWPPTMSCLVAAVCSGTFQGMWSFPGVHIWWRVDHFNTCTTEYYTWCLPGDAFPLAESSWPLGMYSWYSYVKWWWDGFHTRVRTVRCAWVPTATSLRVLWCTVLNETRGKTTSGWRWILPTRSLGWAVSGGAARPGFDDGEGSLRWLSDLQTWSRSFVVRSSSFS
jgi:hypothetical protein